MQNLQIEFMYDMLTLLWKTLKLLLDKLTASQSNPFLMTDEVSLATVEPLFHNSSFSASR